MMLLSLKKINFLSRKCCVWLVVERGASFCVKPIVFENEIFDYMEGLFIIVSVKRVDELEIKNNHN